VSYGASKNRKEMFETGLKVSLDKNYDGAIVEIKAK